MATTQAVETKLSTVLVVADRAQVVRIEGLCSRARTFPAITESNIAQADAILRELTAAGRDIEGTRKTLKAPLLRLGKQIDALAKSIRGPIADAREFLELGISTAQESIEARRLAAEAAARLEAARLETERQRAELARAEALQAQSEREEIIAANAARHGGPSLDVPPSVEIPEVVEPTPVAIVAPAPFKSSVVTRRSVALEIDDPSQIPYQIGGGEPLYTPNEAAIKRAIRAGLSVPGCRLVGTKITGSR